MSDVLGIDIPYRVRAIWNLKTLYDVTEALPQL